MSRKDQEPLSPMLATAISLHEWFLSLREAGFTEKQALDLIVAAMSSNPGDSE